MSEFTVNLLCTLAGMVLTWTVSRVSLRQREKEICRAEAKSDGVLISDVGYIKAGVDDLKKDNRQTHKTLEIFNERITRCEESVKIAHKRLDEMCKE